MPAGVNRPTTVGVLVGLGTFLQAGVPQGSDHYQVNHNGTVTVDYIQTDGVVLQEVDVREIHSFDEAACQITGITGYVRGSLEAFTGGLNTQTIINQILSGQSIASVVSSLG